MKTHPLLLVAALVCLFVSVRADTIDLNYGLVAHLALDGTTQDVTGNGNNGTINGSVSWTADRFGNANSALQFDKNGYVQLSNSLLLNGATSAAITGWFNNQLGSNEYGMVVGAGDGRSGLDPFLLYMLGDGRVAQSIFTQTTRGASAPNRFIGFDSGQENAPQDEWTSFVMQFVSIGNTSIFQFYLDGLLERESIYNYSLRIDFDQSMPVQIGALTGYQDSQFRGTIDDVRFYNRALNTDEIGALNTRVPDGGVTALMLGIGLMGLIFVSRKRAVA